MSDIVERLRKWPENNAWNGERICTEAAAEIERLRVERDEARKTMREWSENCGAEVQRLRGLLRDSLEYIGWATEPAFSDDAVVSEAEILWQRVREALGDGEA